jgi:hypothetical protein
MVQPVNNKIKVFFLQSLIKLKIFYNFLQVLINSNKIKNIIKKNNNFKLRIKVRYFKNNKYKIIYIKLKTKINLYLINNVIYRLQNKIKNILNNMVF